MKYVSIKVLSSLSLATAVLLASGCVFKPSARLNQSESAKGSVTAETRLELVEIDPSSLPESDTVVLPNEPLALAVSKRSSFVCYIDTTSKRVVTQSPISFGAVLQKAADGDFGATVQEKVKAADEVFLAALQSVIKDFADIAAKDGTGDADEVPLKTLRALWEASSARQAFMETVLAKKTQDKVIQAKALVDANVETAQQKIERVKKEVLTWNPVTLTKNVFKFGHEEFNSAFKKEQEGSGASAPSLESGSGAVSFNPEVQNAAQKATLAVEAFADQIISLISKRAIPTAVQFGETQIKPFAKSMAESTKDNRQGVVQALEILGGEVKALSASATTALGQEIQARLAEKQWADSVQKALAEIKRNSTELVQNVTGETESEKQREALFRMAVKAALQTAIATIKVVDRAAEDSAIVLAQTQAAASASQQTASDAWAGVKSMGQFFSKIVSINKDGFKQQETATELKTLANESAGLLDDVSERITAAQGILAGLFQSKQLTQKNLAVVLTTDFENLSISDFSTESEAGLEEFQSFEDFIAKVDAATHISSASCADLAEVKAKLD